MTKVTFTKDGATKVVTDGNEEQMQAVLEAGWKPEEEAGFGSLNVAQLKEQLAALEIEVPQGAKKADLVALLEAHAAEGGEE